MFERSSSWLLLHTLLWPSCTRTIVNETILPWGVALISIAPSLPSRALEICDSGRRTCERND